MVPFLDGSRPTAYVALSSSTPAMLQSVVEQVRLSNLRVIVGATIHDWKAPAHPDVVVGGVMPSHLIMPRVDVAVTMGGQGSVQTAMASGTPLVGIPLHPEQELNVDLAVRQGMALAMAPRHATGEPMSRAVRRLIEEPDFRHQAERVRGLYAHCDGAATAAQAIRNYLRNPRVQPSLDSGQRAFATDSISR